MTYVHSIELFSIAPYYNINRIIKLIFNPKDTILALKNKGADFLLLSDQKQQIKSGDFGTLIFEEDGIRIIKL